MHEGREICKDCTGQLLVWETARQIWSRVYPRVILVKHTNSRHIRLSLYHSSNGIHDTISGHSIIFLSTFSVHFSRSVELLQHTVVSAYLAYKDTTSQG